MMRRGMYARLAATTIAAAALAWPAAELLAQDDDVEPGTRVRIEAPGVSSRAIIGQVTSLRGDTLTIRPQGQDARTILEASSISRIEVSRGFESQTMQWLRTGAVVGGGLGLVIGILATDDAGGVAISALAGGAVGAIGGGFYGSNRTAEAWREVPVPRAEAGSAAHRGSPAAPSRPPAGISIPLF